MGLVLGFCEMRDERPPNGSVFGIPHTPQSASYNYITSYIYLSLSTLLSSLITVLSLVNHPHSLVSVSGVIVHPSIRCCFITLQP